MDTVSWLFLCSFTTSVPFRRTRRTPPTSPTDVPSTDSQSIEGCGLPEAEQSSQPPEELENSRRDGGSITNDGPRRWESKAAVSSEKRAEAKNTVSLDKIYNENLMNKIHYNCFVARKNYSKTFLL